VKNNRYFNFILPIAVVIISLVFLYPTTNNKQKSLILDLKDATIEMKVENDTIDINAVLEKLLKSNNLSLNGILNGHGYFYKDDTDLINVLEKEHDNPLANKLRLLAAKFESIFSNSLRPTTIILSDRFPKNTVAACKDSVYFGKSVLLANSEETNFIITKITKKGPCSRKDINQIYANNDVGKWIADCKNLKSNKLDVKIQLQEDTSDVPEVNSRCTI